MAISDYDPIAGNNTTIGGTNIDEGCSPAGINNAIRQVMADIAADVPDKSNIDTIAGNWTFSGNPDFSGSPTFSGDTALQSFSTHEPFALKSITTLTSGSGTYNTPTGCRAIRVKAVGAGGGGGGAGSAGGSGRAACGGGGGHGGVVEDFITSPAASYTYAVGALGSGGAAGVNAGSAGGDTTFSDGGSLSLTAGGGAGGAGSGSTASNTQNLGGLGGTATGGDLNIPGDPGECGLIVGGDISNLGKGASGPLGSPGRQTLSADGADASGFGAGGGGGSGQDNSFARAGGDGVGGLILVEEYF